MDALDQVAGVERVDLARSGGAPAQHGGGAHPVGRPEDHGAAGGATGVGPVTDAEARHGGETLRGHVAHGTAKI